LNFLTERTLGYYEEGIPKFLFPLIGEVPQGSVLGPILFNVSMFSLHEVELRYSQELVSYADDLALIAGVDRTLDLHRITETIEKLDRNFNYLGLDSNDKTQMVIISTKK